MPNNPLDVDQHQQHFPASLAKAVFWKAVAIQALLLLVLVFGDIGFDRPGRFGLDYGHFLVLAVFWFAASCLGFCMAFMMRHLGSLMLQVAAVIVPVGWVMTH